MAENMSYDDYDKTGDYITPNNIQLNVLTAVPQQSAPPPLPPSSYRSDIRKKCGWISICIVLGIITTVLVFLLVTKIAEISDVKDEINNKVLFLYNRVL